MIIYCTTNLTDGMMYLGKDKYNNPDYLGSGTNLKRAIKKCGRENFHKRIIEHCDNIEELNFAEKDWVKVCNAQLSKKFYNIARGGDGGDTLSKHPNKKAIYEKSGSTLKRLIREGVIKVKRTNLSTNQKRNISIGLKKSEKYKKSMQSENYKQKQRTNILFTNAKRVTCKHCGKENNYRNHKQYHGENCLKNPSISSSNLVKRSKKADKISASLQNVAKSKCIHCGVILNKSAIIRFHNSHCYKNPSINIEEEKIFRASTARNQYSNPVC